MPERWRVAVELILVDISDDLPIAWRNAFAGLRGVTIVTGRFEEVEDYDCMVSPANSFGIMDGGGDVETLPPGEPKATLRPVDT